MEIKVVELKDLDKLQKLEESSFSKPWSRETLEELLESDRARVLGFFEEEELLGYSCLEWVLDEGSLTNIAVAPEHRRKGFASILMEKTIEFAKEKDMAFIFLEVRVSNESAVNLYRKYGFEDAGVRKNYYSAPVEDALLMTLNLK